MSDIKWYPRYYANIDDNKEDSDYLRRQCCCVSCGAYIGNLPGYYYLEEDYCPNCRKESGGFIQSVSCELECIDKEQHLAEFGEPIAEWLEECKELGI
jgi:hypothetical protein